MNDIHLDFDIRRQPDNTTCGPTCLHAVYAYYDDPVSLQDVIFETEKWIEGGTLETYLACHALRRGYRATIIPFNLQVFDPTWKRLSNKKMMEKLRRQLYFKKRVPGLEIVTNAYLEFLHLGGQLRFEVMTPSLIRRYLKKSIPILTGLSATYLYDTARECEAGRDIVHDDVRGESSGHFVVLTGYNRVDRSVQVADPFRPAAFRQRRYYAVNIYRLVCAILLGILSYDGNLLIIEPKKKKRV
jgi:hypothetical protein